MVQDISSFLVGKLLPLEKNDRVLDLCASPGGKTFHAADRLCRLDPSMHPVLSCDLRPDKVMRIEENRRFYHMEDKVTTLLWDATRPGLLETIKQEPFDIVIADVPCSGLGMLGNKPDIRHRLTEKDLESLAALQKEILRQAASYVRPGGTLLYSTCTLNPAENSDQMLWFCENFPFYEDTGSDKEIREAFGLCKYQPYREKKGYSLLPGEYPGEGFYLCRLTKRFE